MALHAEDTNWLLTRHMAMNMEHSEELHTHASVTVQPSLNTCVKHARECTAPKPNTGMLLTLELYANARQAASFCRPFC